MKAFALGILLLVTACSIQAQNRHKVVIQFTDSDSVSQASVLGQVKNIKNDLPDTDIEVVCHGPGLDLLVRKTSKAATQIAEWKSKGVTFAACSNTMKRRGIKPEDLQQEATIVPSAMTQLIKRQEEGWSYVKGGH